MGGVNMGEWRFFETKRFHCMIQVGTGLIIAYESQPGFQEECWK